MTPSYVHTKTIKVLNVGAEIVELEDGWWMTRNDYRIWQLANQRHEEVWMDNRNDRKQITVQEKPVGIENFYRKNKSTLSQETGN